MNIILEQLMKRLTRATLGKLLGAPTSGSLVEHKESGAWAFVDSITADPYHIGANPSQMLYVCGVMVDDETGKPVNSYADYWAFSDVITIANATVAQALKAMIYEVQAND